MGIKKVRKTQEEFVREVYNLVGNDYSVIGEYKTIDVKIKMMHNNTICNYFIFEVRPKDFLNNKSKCPMCSKNKKKTPIEFKNEIFKLFGDEYDVLDNYINAKTEIRFKHNICNTIWKTQPSIFLTRKGNCPNCNYETKRKKLALSENEFLKKIKGELENKFYTNEKYINTNTKMTFFHKDCNRSFITTPKSLFKYKNCQICMKEEFVRRQTKSNENFKREVFDLVGNEYSVMGEYINCKTKIDMIHNVCNKSFGYLPNNFLHNNRRCPFCSNKWFYTTEIFQERINDIHNNEILLLEEYIDTNTKRKFKHLNCNKIWETKPYYLIAGNGCPYCNSSKGEIKIREKLTKLNINFVEQKTFKDCMNKRCLPFDFMVEYSEDKYILIEYDGIQHFEPIGVFGGEEEFKKVQCNDHIKNKYCKDNNIPLLRIPYWDFDKIEEILNDYINTIQI